MSPSCAASSRVRSSPCSRAARVRVVALGALTLCALSPVAGATTYFNLASIPGPTPSATVTFEDNALTSEFSGFFYDYVDLSANSSTMTASLPSGASLGTVELQGGVTEPNSYLAYPAADTVSARPDGASGIDYEHYHATGPLTNLVYSPTLGESLLSATLNGFSIYAAPGSRTATIELDLTNATSAAIAGLPSTLYLDLTGTTATPVSLSTIVYSKSVTLATFGSMTLDLAGTVSDTPFTPSPVPLPATAVLMLAGLGGLGLAARRRRD